MMGIVPMGGQQAQNLANGGNNETNRQRQALAQTPPNEIDNRLANTQGVAQTLANEVEEEDDEEEIS